MEWLNNIDRELFLALNALGSPYLDQLMIGLSNKFIWIPLYCYIIIRLYLRFGSSVYWYVGIILLMILFSDQITSSLLKPFIERLRPCKDPTLDGIMTLIGHCRGKFGFASGHAANSMGVAWTIYLIEKSTFSKALVVWALVVAYSRVYLGVHYPGDILAGALIGLLISSIIYTVSAKFIRVDSNNS